MKRFMSFILKEILKARRFVNAALAHEEMQRAYPESVRDRTPPHEPKETNPTYRILAAPLIV